jgi:hypothetical protein
MLPYQSWYGLSTGLRSAHPRPRFSQWQLQSSPPLFDHVDSSIDRNQSIVVMRAMPYRRVKSGPTDAIRENWEPCFTKGRVMPSSALWCKQDLFFLTDALRRGMSFAEVAGFLGRGVGEVRHKAEQLGVKVPHPLLNRNRGGGLRSARLPRAHRH